MLSSNMEKYMEELTTDKNLRDFFQFTQELEDLKPAVFAQKNKQRRQLMKQNWNIAYTVLLNRIQEESQL